MGCDIHLKVQRKVGDTWVSVPYFDYFSVKYPRKDFAEKLVPGAIYLELENRNYNAFAVLANVRNGTWSDPIPSISEPRGLPEDINYDEDSYEFGDHSFSWVTLEELLAYDWDAAVQNRGYVSKEWADAWDGKAKPECYSAWSSHGVEVYWRSTVREMVGEHFMSSIEALKMLGAPKDVRLVFGFDS